MLAALRADEPEPSLARIEDTLTAGYAHALALEAESWRLERRLGELTQMLADGESAAGTHNELVLLARRMAATTDELGRLRDLLGALNRHASDVRASAVPA